MKRFNKNLIVTAVVVSLAFGLVGPIAALAATAPSLGAAASFSVLGFSSVTNTGATTLSGDVGIWSGSSITGMGTLTVGGATHITDTTAQNAQANALTADSTGGSSLTGQANTGGSLGALDSLVLTPGVYDLGAGSLGGGVLTLNGPGVYIFRTSSSLTSAGSVVLENGATACNVFWHVASLATINGTSFAGTIIAGTGVHFGSGVSLDGRALAIGGDVTMIHDTISGPTCATSSTTATLNVVKTVIGGSAAPSDFTLHVKNSSGVVVTSTPGVAGAGVSFTLPAGTYTVSEDGNTSYTQSFLAGDCSGGSVALSAGDDKTCTIINTNIPVIPSGSINTGSGRIVPLIGIVKVPTPLALPTGTGSVTYNYTVWNVGGQQALDNVSVTDDKCGPVTYVSGDVNGNGKLDPHEDWKYTCTATLAKTTTDTATAIGYSDDVYHQASIATAVATVVVGAPVTPPIINIVKVPSRLTPFPFGGGNVTYVYTVTNPGVVAMNNVSVTDDKCASVSYVSGDANSNNLLDPGETWAYTCRTNVPVSSVNVATAKGTANGFTAIDYAFATVLVAAPGLPNTGFPPRENSIPRDIAVAVAVLMIASVSFIAVLKKRKV